MDSDLAALTALLLDPFLTRTEAEREAAAAPRRDRPATDRREGRDCPDSRA